ncbi:MAG: hypothetical protein ABFE08_22350 [Armatimonadia bacterium]
MRWNAKVVMVAMLVVALAVVLVGCGGNNDQTVFQNVIDRTSYNPAGNRVAFTSLGGNGLEYIYSISSGGGSLVLLTQSTNDEDDSNEGGKQPAWSPDGSDIAMVTRRGGGSQSLYLIDSSQGNRLRETRITDNTVTGSDLQPSWAPNSSKLVYVSNKGGGDHYTIWTVDRDGTDAAELYDPGTDAQWPVYSPDGTKIAFQLGIGRSGANTDIAILDIASLTTTNITESSTFRDEAPNWSPDGNKIAFHSNRRGDFDIWTMNVDGTSPVSITADARSDGYPVWNAAGSRIAFTRNRELWTMLPDGTDQDQVTQTSQ